MNNETRDQSRLQTNGVGAKIYQQIRGDLMHGFYRPGQKLKLRHVASQLGVSVTPVREALMKLVSESALIRLDQGTVSVPVLLPEHFVEMWNLRLHLEGSTAARAAERATDQQIEIIETFHAQHARGLREGDYREVFQGNERFHLGICRIAEMPVTQRIIETLWLQFGPAHGALQEWRPAQPPKRHPHRMVIEGLRKRDPEMARRGIEEDININSEPVLRFLRAAYDGSIPIPPPSIVGHGNDPEQVPNDNTA